MARYVLTKLTWPITRLLERDLIRREVMMKIGETVWINERRVGLFIMMLVLYHF